jgi:hypothetical protein
VSYSRNIVTKGHPSANLDQADLRIALLSVGGVAGPQSNQAAFVHYPAGALVGSLGATVVENGGPASLSVVGAGASDAALALDLTGSALARSRCWR